MKRHASGASPRGMAAGNQLAAAVVLLPLLLVLPPLAAPSALVLANLLALALLASGVAFVLYFRLIANVPWFRARGHGVVVKLVRARMKRQGALART